MSAEELDNYEAEVELSLYREYRDVVSQFSYVIETERRFYLANAVELILFYGCIVFHGVYVPHFLNPVYYGHLGCWL